MTEPGLTPETSLAGVGRAKDRGQRIQAGTHLENQRKSTYMLGCLMGVSGLVREDKVQRVAL